MASGAGAGFCDGFEAGFGEDFFLEGVFFFGLFSEVGGCADGVAVSGALA
jgi:hypothetical protein